MLDVKYLVTLEDLSSDDLVQMYKEAKSKLQENELSTRVFLINSILKERREE